MIPLLSSLLTNKSSLANHKRILKPLSTSTSHWRTTDSQSRHRYFRRDTLKGIPLHSHPSIYNSQRPFTYAKSTTPLPSPNSSPTPFPKQSPTYNSALHHNTLFVVSLPSQVPNGVEHDIGPSIPVSFLRMTAHL